MKARPQAPAPGERAATPISRIVSRIVAGVGSIVDTVGGAIGGRGAATGARMRGGRRPARPDAARGITVERRLPASTLGLARDRISNAALRTCEGLQKAGYQAYVVGGGVRDSALGRAPKDFDVATDAPPEDVQKLFRRARIIGRRFQINHVIFGRETIEVTTFRALQVDAQTDEHGRVLRDNLFGTMQEDALRRDFTVNALYYDPVSEEVVDFLGGVDDLEARRLRMIGDPATRYREDPVRMLRTVRFAAKLGFDVDPPTLAPIRALADLLENVPAARLFDEILKLLESGHALACIQRLRHEGLHHGVLPLLDSIFEDGERFVTLALEQTDRRVNAGKSVSPSFLFATLLWQQVLRRWQQRLAGGAHAIPSLHEAIDEVLDEQGAKLAIQRRFQADMREIWTMQPRLERRSRQSYRLLEHLRFRAGYDFLLLRCEAGELPDEIGRWWTDFIDGDTARREALIDGLTAAPGAPRKRRKRRKRPGGADATGNTDAGSGADGDGEADPEADRDTDRDPDRDPDRDRGPAGRPGHVSEGVVGARGNASHPDAARHDDPRASRAADDR
ncbi:MAG: polynucleotide adenylyltransferase PcnB [Lautropia sp.]